jgi:hypothetical protein
MAKSLPLFILENLGALRLPLPSEPPEYRLRLYHATLVDNWDSICATGLQAGKAEASGQDFDSKWKGEALYYFLHFPGHELDNGYDTETGEPYLLVIEAEATIPAQNIVPDEDTSGDVDYTPKAIQNREPIAVTDVIPATNFVCIHMIDTEAARQWASENVDGIEVKFHKGDSSIYEKMNPNYQKYLDDEIPNTISVPKVLRAFFGKAARYSPNAWPLVTKVVDSKFSNVRRGDMEDLIRKHGASCKIKLSDLTYYQPIIDIRGTMHQGEPVLVVDCKYGKMLFDGNHRAIDSILDGFQTIDAIMLDCKEDELST